MATQITHGIKVSVEVFFQPEYSRPEKGRNVFSYRITIENQSSKTVQLLRRHWQIFDSIGQKREVEGEGVIGEQPIIAPGSTHQYTSWCPLLSDMGSMRGTYLMVSQDDGERFRVRIPEFMLIAPERQN
jgi:ApaG protein